MVYYSLCQTPWNPIYENTGSRDPVIDPVNDPVKDNTALLVLNVIRNHPGIRRNAIAQIVGVSEATVKRRLRDLSSNVEFRGAPKTGGYYIIEAVAKLQSHVDAFVSNASNKNEFLLYDAIETIASTGFATASIEGTAD